jgi:ribonucleoside-diphosphate reductase alpha chain
MIIHLSRFWTEPAPAGLSIPRAFSTPGVHPFDQIKAADGFDVERFKAAVRIFITAQEILVDAASYPTPAIAVNSHRFRPLGLGFANLGALIMSYGLGYDSDEGREMAAAITALMTGEAYAQSARLAGVHGAFPGYRDARALGVEKPLLPDNVESMREVMELHRAAAQALGASMSAEARAFPVVQAACDAWHEAIVIGVVHGYRNAQATVAAPSACPVGETWSPPTGVCVAFLRWGNPVGLSGSPWTSTSLPTSVLRTRHSSSSMAWRPSWR